jgi:hypothetical protein
VHTNDFINNDNVTGRPFDMSTNHVNANARLSLMSNTAQSNHAGDDYFLTNNAGSFSVEDLLNLSTNNVGTFDLTGTITDDPGFIPTP